MYTISIFQLIQFNLKPPDENHGIGRKRLHKVRDTKENNGMRNNEKNIFKKTDIGLCVCLPYSRMFKSKVRTHISQSIVNKNNWIGLIASFSKNE